MRAPSPTTVPSLITTWPPISTLSGSSTPSPRRRPGARSDGRSTRAPVERALQRLEHAHHAHATVAAGARLAPVGDPFEEVPALDAQRLLVRHPRRPDVARAHDVLAVRGEVLVEALVVDRDFALDLHVVEGGHLLRADHREAALLVRIEPGEVQVRGQAGREAQVAEDHVLHAVAHVALAEGLTLAGLLTAREVE